MDTREFFKQLLQVPEFADLGKPQERAAFAALHIEGRTMRDAAQTIGISKSNVQNLANLFIVKLHKRVAETRKKKESTRSKEFQALEVELSELLPTDFDEGREKIGNFEPGVTCREDIAEAFGSGSPRFDDE